MASAAHLPAIADPPRRRRRPDLDVARAVALLIMLAMNFTGTMEASYEGPDWLVALTDVLEGHGAALFVVLSGMGVTLLAKREGPRAPRTILARAAILFGLGLVLVPLWEADVLRSYGLFLAASVACVGLSTRRLWSAALGSTAAFCVLFALLDFYDAWEIDGSIAAHGIHGSASALLFNGYYPLFPWVSLVLLGVWLGRIDLVSSRLRWRLLLGGLSLAAAAELGTMPALTALGEMLPPALDGLTSLDPSPPGLPFLLSAGGTAVASIVLCTAAVDRLPRPITFALSSAGQMTLTIYVAHIVIGMYALELVVSFEDRSLAFALGYAALFWGVAIAWASAWRATHRRGPLEAGVRGLSKGLESCTLVVVGWLQPRHAGQTDRHLGLAAAPGRRGLGLRARVSAVHGTVLVPGPRPTGDTPAAVG